MMATSQSDPCRSFIPGRSCAIELPIVFWVFKAESPVLGSLKPYFSDITLGRIVDLGTLQRHLSVTTVARRTFSIIPQG
jgi:hypothetical protein